MELKFTSIALSFINRGEIIPKMNSTTQKTRTSIYISYLKKKKVELMTYVRFHNLTAIFLCNSINVVVSNANYDRLNSYAILLTSM